MLYDSKVSRRKALSNKKDLKNATTRQQAGWRLDLAEKIGPDWLELLFVGIRIQEPESCRQAAEQGISVLGSKTGADNLFIASHCQALTDDDRLVENSSKQPMITTKREYGSRGLLIC